MISSLQPSPSSSLASSEPLYVLLICAISLIIVPRRVTKDNEDCMTPLSPLTGSMFAVTMATNEKLTFSLPEVAKLLVMSSSKVYEAVKAKEIPSISFGKRIVIPKSST